MHIVEIVIVGLHDMRNLYLKPRQAYVLFWCLACISKSFLRQVGTPRTHRRFLARDKGTYGPMPRGTPKGLLGMPFNTTVS